MVFNRRQAAAYLKISVESIDSLREKGRLAFCRIGKRIVFKQEQLDELLETSVVPAKSSSPPSEALYHNIS
jgi:excisionase family DNA binding protein